MVVFDFHMHNSRKVNEASSGTGTEQEGNGGPRKLERRKWALRACSGPGALHLPSHLFFITLRASVCFPIETTLYLWLDTVPENHLYVIRGHDLFLTPYWRHRYDNNTPHHVGRGGGRWVDGLLNISCQPNVPFCRHWHCRLVVKGISSKLTKILSISGFCYRFPTAANISVRMQLQQVSECHRYLPLSMESDVPSRETEMTQGSDGGPNDSTLRFWKQEKRGKVGLRREFCEVIWKRRGFTQNLL